MIRKEIYILRPKLFLFITAIILIILCGDIFAEKSEIKKQASSSTIRAMARVYMAYGQYAKAEPLAERALLFVENKNASDDERCLCLIDLAYIYSQTGKLQKALEKCSEGLRMQEKIYGDCHPHSAYTLRILASVYQQQNKFDLAKSALDQAVQIMQKTLCLADPRVIAPFNIDLANLFIQQGEYELAEEYFEKALPAISESFGSEHLYTATILGNMAKLHVLQGRYSQAELLITKTITIQEKIYGHASCLIAPAWITMANICWAKGQFAKAEQYIQKSLSAIEKTGNVTQLVAFQQKASEIRSTKPVAFGLIAKAGN